MNQKSPQLSGPIEFIVKFLAGMAAAAAGVSGLLSLAGFLLLRAHANLLGISSVLHHSVGDYLYEGGAFLVLTILWALPVSIFGTIYGWIFIGVLVLYLLWKSFGSMGHRFSKSKNPLGGGRCTPIMGSLCIHCFCRPSTSGLNLPPSPFS